MKRYAVFFEKSAQEDVRESYDWGFKTTQHRSERLDDCWSLSCFVRHPERKSTRTPHQGSLQFLTTDDADKIGFTIRIIRG
jgi:hypothetical protein